MAWSGCLHEASFSGKLLDLSLFSAYIGMGQGFKKKSEKQNNFTLTEILLVQKDFLYKIIFNNLLVLRSVLRLQM